MKRVHDELKESFKELENSIKSEDLEELEPTLDIARGALDKPKLKAEDINTVIKVIDTIVSISNSEKSKKIAVSIKTKVIQILSERINSSQYKHKNAIKRLDKSKILFIATAIIEISSTIYEYMYAEEESEDE